MSRNRGFCFTLNNYTEANEAALKQLDVTYGIYGREEAPTTGTKHLQGYLYFKSQKTCSAVNKILAEKGLRPYVAAAKGNAESNRTYCSKGGDFEEWGVMPAAGKRNDILDMHETIKGGASAMEVMEAHPATYFKYSNAADKAIRMYKDVKAAADIRDQFKDVTLRPWQQNCNTRLSNQTDRQVTWVVDEEGNQGKTWYAKYLVATKNAFYTNGGKAADIFYAYNYEGIVVFDFTRTQEEIVNYSAIEAFKNGMVFSSKYQSTLKITTPPKVLCLSNWEPDQSKLSRDRWDIVRLTAPRRGPIDDFIYTD